MSPLATSRHFDPARYLRPFQAKADIPLRAHALDRSRDDMSEQRTDLPVVPMCRINTRCAVGQITANSSRVSCLGLRGVAHRHQRGARDAMDVNAPPDERRLFADGEAVWSRRLDAGVKLPETSFARRW